MSLRCPGLCLLMGLLTFVVALPVAAQTSASVKIGVIGPFSGPSSDFGTPMLHGIELARDQINALGGYLGRPLELVIKDDQGKPEVGRQASQELIKEGVIATLGFCNTGVAAQSLDVFQDSRVPLIIPCSTGTPLTARYPASQSYIFRTSARDSIQAPLSGVNRLSGS
jgi:branched-chain amino acid transport system substrate-binding protein